MLLLNLARPRIAWRSSQFFDGPASASVASLGEGSVSIWDGGRSLSGIALKAAGGKEEPSDCAVGPCLEPIFGLSLVCLDIGWDE